MVNSYLVTKFPLLKQSIIILYVLIQFGEALPVSNYARTSGNILSKSTITKPFMRSYFRMGKVDTIPNVESSIGGEGQLFTNKNRIQYEPLNYYRSSAHRRTLDYAPGAYSWGYRWIEEKEPYMDAIHSEIQMLVYFYMQS